MILTPIFSVQLSLESLCHLRNISPVYTTIFLARYLFEFGPGT